jgi:hypothetical protein
MTQSSGNEDRADLIARVLTGELATDAPEVVAACRLDPALSAELAELQDLVDEIDVAAGAAAPPARRADPEPWSGADQMMRQIAAEHRATPIRPSSGPGHVRRWWLVGLIAAAAVVLAVWLGTANRLPQAPPEFQLGRSLWPRVEVSRAELAREGFRWADPAQPTRLGSFRVTIHDDQKNSLLESPQLGTAERWLPTAEQVQALPDTIQWTVTLTIADQKHSWSETATLRR